jgi:hypothetical protein
MRSAFSVRPRLAWLAVPLLLVACGQSGPDSRAASAAPAEAAPQAPATAAMPAADAAELPVVHVYKTPTCGCCADWVTHIEAAGFRTEVQDLPNLTAVRERAGVPHHLGSCHTALVGDYVIEGHVPASTIRRMLMEKPAIAGIAVPGMPLGSPGMEQGPYKDPYDVIAFTRDGRGMVYESH